MDSTRNADGDGIVLMVIVRDPLLLLGDLGKIRHEIDDFLFVKIISMMFYYLTRRKPK